MCEFCERGKPLAIGKTNDYGLAIQYPNKIIAFGYDVHGAGSNGLVKKSIIALSAAESWWSNGGNFK